MSLPEGLVSLAIIEREHILRVLRYCDGNIARASRILDISRSTLNNKLKQYYPGVPPHGMRDAVLHPAPPAQTNIVQALKETDRFTP